MPRAARAIYPRVIAAPNVRAALREAARGKRRRPEVAAFLVQAEERLADLTDDLRTGRWSPAPLRTIVIREPKTRLIAAAPFCDRIVHHAIHRLLAPVLMRSFVHDTYACLPGRGTHRAVLRFREGLLRHPWVARMDMVRYFLEIDWDVLLGVIRHRVADRRMLELLETVLAGGAGLYARNDVLDALGLRGRYHPSPRKGLPIGSLTSQLFANVYLDGLDHFAKRELKVPLYVRYMDDVALFGRDRRRLERKVAACAEWLGAERGLAVHEARVAPQRTTQTFRFLGHVVSRTELRVRARSERRLLARLEAGLGDVDGTDVDELAQRVSSALGLVLF